MHLPLGLRRALFNTFLALGTVAAMNPASAEETDVLNGHYHSTGTSDPHTLDFASYASVKIEATGKSYAKEPNVTVTDGVTVASGAELYMHANGETNSTKGSLTAAWIDGTVSMLRSVTITGVAQAYVTGTEAGNWMNVRGTDNGGTYTLSRTGGEDLVVSYGAFSLDSDKVNSLMVGQVNGSSAATVKLLQDLTDGTITINSAGTLNANRYSFTGNSVLMQAGGQLNNYDETALTVNNSSLFTDNNATLNVTYASSVSGNYYTIADADSKDANALSISSGAKVTLVDAQMASLNVGNSAGVTVNNDFKLNRLDVAENANLTVSDFDLELQMAAPLKVLSRRITSRWRLAALSPAAESRRGTSSPWKAGPI